MSDDTLAAALAAKEQEVAELREEVAVLRWQADDNAHPLTCGNDSSHDILDYRNGELFCHDCDWTQPIPAVVLDAARAAGGDA